MSYMEFTHVKYKTSCQRKGEIVGEKRREGVKERGREREVPREGEVE